MPKKAFADDVSAAQVMLAGLKAHTATLERRGLGADFQDTLETKINSSISTNNEQEKLKADQETKTAELKVEVKGMNALVAEARKIVKMDIPKEQWKEFGI